MRENKKEEMLIYDGKVIKLYKDKVLCPNGSLAFREVVKHSGGSAVLCIKDDSVLLIKQYRYAYDEVLYEIPAGKLENSEDPLLAAKREFEEETGNKPINIEYLGKIYPSCGYTNEVIYIYLVDDFVKTETSFDEDEFIETEFVLFDKVLNMISDGTITDAKTICAINYYLLKNK